MQKLGDRWWILLTVLQHQKNWAVMLIYVCTVQHLSLKMLIYSEIYIKPLKTFLFTFFKKKKWKGQFPLPQLVKTDSYPPTLVPLTLLVTDRINKTQTYCLNKSCPKKVECLKTLHLELKWTFYTFQREVKQKHVKAIFKVSVQHECAISMLR